jgi:hypothetical protein
MDRVCPPYLAVRLGEKLRHQKNEVCLGSVPKISWESYASRQAVRPVFTIVAIRNGVVTSEGADNMLLSFLQGTYEAEANLGEWDRSAFEGHEDNRPTSL